MQEDAMRLCVLRVMCEVMHPGVEMGYGKTPFDQTQSSDEGRMNPLNASLRHTPRARQDA